MRRLVPIAITAAALLVAPTAEATFRGANGRLAAHVDTDRGPRVASLRLDGRGWRRIGKLDASVPYAEEQSGRAKWSPSGRRVVYVNLVRGVEVRSASGRLLRRIRTTEGRDPAWAPSGREIVTASYDEEDGALVRMRLDATVVRRLPLPQLAGAMYPEWSPDGRWIVFQEARPRATLIWRMRPDGTGMERLGEGRNPTWSPDGRRIAVSTFRYGFGIARPYRLLTVPAGGGRATVHRHSGTLFQWPDWQPR